MKDNKYICRFMATAVLCAYAYYGINRIADVVNEGTTHEDSKPYIHLTSGEVIDPATAPEVTKFEEGTAREFVEMIFGDMEEAPDLNEFLSRFTCSNCGKKCLLTSPRCHVGQGSQGKVIAIYQEMYPEVELT